MWFEYLHIIKGIEVRFQSYLLNLHDLHMQLEVFPIQLTPTVVTLFREFLFKAEKMHVHMNFLKFQKNSKNFKIWKLKSLKHS